MKRKLLFAMLCIVSVLGMRAQTWTGNDVAAGDFYLYNVAEEKFLTSGNSWGTQGTLTPAGGFLLTLEGSGNEYDIKVTETRTNNKAAGPGYVGATGYMDAENSEGKWTFTKVEQGGVTAYRITGTNGALRYSGSGTVVDVASDATDNSLWVLVSKQDRLNAMAAADADHPVDATFLLKNPDFGRYKLPAYDAAWTWTFPDGENKNNAGDNTNFCVESYHKAFDFCQAVENAPTGYYAVRGQAFYRQDGSNNTNLPYFYVGDQTVTFPAKTGDEGSMSAASTSFTAGNYQTTWSSAYTFSSGTLNVGTHLNTNTGLWCIWDNIQIQYYGPIDLSVEQANLANAVAAAEAYESQLPDAVYDNIESVITANNKTWSTADEYIAAITAINNAVSTYATAAIIADYARYNSIKSAAKAIASGTNTATADSKVEAATTTAAIDAAIVTLRAAFLAELPNVTIPGDPGYIDVTSVMVDNASVSANVDYWTTEKTSGNGPTTNYGETEFYNANFKFYQTLALTPGTWEFGVTGFHRGGQGDFSTYFYAGTDRILIPGVASDVVNTMAQAKTYFDGGNGKVALKFLIETAGDVEIGINNQDTQTDKWTIFRDFTLKYYGAPDYSVYETQWSDLVAEANTAKTNHANVTGDELTALNVAIADSPAGSNLKATYNEKISALQDALQTFNAAAPAYDKYDAYKVETEGAWGTDFNVAAPTNAAGALVAVQNLNIAQYNKVADEYTYSASGLIGDFGTWTATATYGTDKTTSTPNYLDNEHWSGTTHAYYEQCSEGWGNAGGWTIQYEKTCTLPAGNYVIKVAARTAGTGVTSLVSCTATSATVTLPAESAFARGIKLNGEAGWDGENSEYARDGEGYGWQWRFLPFTLADESNVTMTFYAEASSQYQWMSIGDAELLSTTKLAQDVAYDEDADNTIESTIIADVTMTRTMKVGYNTVVLPFTLTANQVKAAFGTDCVVYNYSEDSADPNSADLTFTSGDGSINANVPVLVKATAVSNEQSFNGVQIVAPTSAKVEGTNFDYVGVYANTTIAEGDYFLGTKEGTQYVFQSNGTDSAKPFRAYFHKKTTGNVRANLFIDAVATAIEAIEAQPAEQNGAIFNLAGQRVNKAQKGLYIINGKKVVIK